MRVLRYKLELSEFGYMIASGNIMATDNIVELRTTLPIRVIVPEGYENQFDTIVPKLICSEKKNLDFRDHYQEILLGRHPDWYLYSCEVTARSLILGCYNRKLNKEGSIIFEELSQPIKFQLVVPSQNNKPDSIYDVYLLAGSNDLKNPEVKHYEAGVTEYFMNGFRQLTFPDESCRNPISDKFVYVDEYVD